MKQIHLQNPSLGAVEPLQAEQQQGTEPPVLTGAQTSNYVTLMSSWFKV